MENISSHFSPGLELTVQVLDVKDGQVEFALVGK